MNHSTLYKIYLLTFGYIRELETDYSFKYKLPQEITKLIFNYHPRDFSAIGFITQNFNEIERNELNIGNNDSLIACGNGWFVTSPCFDKLMNNHRTFEYGLNKELYNEGDEMIVQINTLKKQAYIQTFF